MQPKSRKKLQLTGETLRTLTLRRSELGRVVGGISGPRGCHSIDDHCPTPSGGVTCNSADSFCQSEFPTECDTASAGSVC